MNPIIEATKRLEQLEEDMRSADRQAQEAQRQANTYYAAFLYLTDQVAKAREALAELKRA